MKDSTLRRMDDARHRIPFWWWLAYDALVGLVILLGFLGHEAATLVLGVAVLSVAVAIDAVEFLVKRPSSRKRLGA